MQNYTKENQMRHQFMGLQVKYLAEYNIDMDTAAIFKWFVDFKDTGKMKRILINGDYYYWLCYRAFLKDCPNIKIGVKQLSRKLDKLVGCGVLLKYILKKGGSYSYFAPGPNIGNLTNKGSDYEKACKEERQPPEDINVCNKEDSRHKSPLSTGHKCPDKDPNTINNHVTRFKDHVQHIKYTKQHSEIAIKIASHVLSLNPGDRFLNTQYDKTIHNWSDEIRKMTDIDKRQIDYIIKVLDFAINDDFWCNNILSAGKLRKQYDTLYVQMLKRKNRNKPKRNIERDGYGYNQAQ
jgi:hypothetical protein